MDSLDIDVLTQVVRWLGDGHRATLGTVTRTWGSAPRPIGSMMAIRDDGQVIGSVSGGCIEDDLIARVRRGELAAHVPEVVRYGVATQDAQRFGLPCGGTVEMVLEPIGARAMVDDLLSSVEASERVWRELDLRTGAVTMGAAGNEATLRFDGRRLRTVHGPQYRLMLIGAGQLSQYLAPMALALDYQVIVCDPRDEYREPWLQQPRVTLTREMPDDAVVAMRPDAHTAVVALTHDPKLDDLALMEALRSPAFYVGALGSRLNNDRRRGRLRELDLTDDQIARLRGPVGLDIGALTPPEIALSILAEMTAFKRDAGIVVGGKTETTRSSGTAGCVL